MLETGIEKLAGAKEIFLASIGIIGCLLSLVYNNMNKRIEKCEKDTELLIKISGDVEHIKKHCNKC